MFPYLICMSLTAMITGVLNAYRKFLVAALAPLLLNVTAIGALVLAVVLELDTVSVGRLL